MVLLCREKFIQPLTHNSEKLYLLKQTISAGDGSSHTAPDFHAFSKIEFFRVYHFDIAAGEIVAKRRRNAPDSYSLCPAGSTKPSSRSIQKRR
jgi:hypothetical protein